MYAHMLLFNHNRNQTKHKSEQETHF